MSTSSTPKQSSPGKAVLGFSVLLFLISISVVGMATWVYVTKLKPATDPLVRLKGALESITQQQVTQDGHTLEIQTTEIKELAVTERDMQTIIKYETTFLGSKKSIILRGNFRAKAGFDLSKAGPFSIIDGEVIGQAPEAQILSVELQDYEIYHSQDGAWNKLQPADQERATNQLLEQARKDAAESDLTERANEQFQQRLDDLTQPQVL